MSTPEIFLFLFVLILVAILMFMSYLAGRRTAEKVSQTSSELTFRRPVNSYLFYDAPVEVKKELYSDLKLGLARGILLPEEFDARSKWPDAIGEALDQGECGSCWAFASATSVADRLRISEPDNMELRDRFSYKPFIRNAIPYVIMNTLSPYELVYCDICEATFDSFPETSSYVSERNRLCDKGCDGGYISQVYKYILENGIPSIICSPPSCDPSARGKACLCTKNYKECRIYKPKEIYAIFNPTDSEEVRVRKIKEELITYGPITTTYSLYNSFFEFFSKNPTGIYTDDPEKIPGDFFLGGHAVSVVGWGTDPVSGTRYWVCRNSWGIQWGDQGFFKIRYNWKDFLEPIWMAARF